MGPLAAGGAFEVTLEHIRLAWAGLDLFRIICNDRLFNHGFEHSEF